MIDLHVLATSLGMVVLAAPTALLLLVGAATLAGTEIRERAISRGVQIATAIGLMAALGVLAAMLLSGDRHVVVYIGDWVAIPHFHFSLKFVFDRLSVPFVILSLVLCGTIGAFAASYLHREAGFNRFFVLLALFLLGMVLTSLAGTIETLFAGWELVGVSSALLVAFFQERVGPVRNGLHVWSVYRVSDAALLMAAVLLHHLTGEGDFDKLLGVGGSWPDSHTTISSGQALAVGILLLVAAAGKSALIPFSGWLPRAMEGPTPSSAVFYGALSVHLGVYLLLRASPLIERSWLLAAVVVTLGLSTALLAALAARVQTDIKSALSFAALTQVGIIVAEIGLGWHYIPLVHIIGHACLRTLQFLRASSILADYRQLENALGQRLPGSAPRLEALVPAGLSRWTYRLVLERGYLDAVLHDYLVRPLLAVFAGCDALERRWTNFLAGRPSRESDELSPVAGSLEDLA
jgi:NADH-quinone oxidoreductase subunit L